MTNAEKIRNMTDEELASFLSVIYCQNAWLEWLGKEASE